MTRPLRIVFPGANYHVTVRGNARQDIFLSPWDNAYFLSVLSNVVKDFQWRCHAYCLMSNHFHLLLETPLPNLSAGMKLLNSIYSGFFNRNHLKVGHVLQGRFHSPVIKDETHMLVVARYISLNPVEAGIVEKPEQWEWSSYSAIMGLTKVPSFLTVEPILSIFDSEKQTSRKAFGEFVGNGIGIGKPLQIGTAMVGTGDLSPEVLNAISQIRHNPEFNRRDRYANRKPLDEIFEGLARNKRDRAARIKFAYHENGYTLAEIGAFLNKSISTISRALKIPD